MNTPKLGSIQRFESSLGVFSRFYFLAHRRSKSSLQVGEIQFNDTKLAEELVGSPLRWLLQRFPQQLAGETLDRIDIREAEYEV